MGIRCISYAIQISLCHHMYHVGIHAAGKRLWVTHQYPITTAGSLKVTGSDTSLRPGVNSYSRGYNATTQGHIDRLSQAYLHTRCGREDNPCRHRDCCPTTILDVYRSAGL